MVESLSPATSPYRRNLFPPKAKRGPDRTGQRRKHWPVPVALSFLLLLSTLPVWGQNPSSVPQEKEGGWTEKSLKGTFRKAYYSNDGVCRIYLFRAEHSLLIITQKELGDNQIVKEQILLEKKEGTGYSPGVSYSLVEESGEKSIILKKKPNILKTYLGRTGQAESLPPEVRAALESLGKF
jgi:hypothetical protein